jgi:hypothetical protein
MAPGEICGHSGAVLLLDRVHGCCERHAQSHMGGYQHIGSSIYFQAGTQRATLTPPKLPLRNARNGSQDGFQIDCRFNTTESGHFATFDRKKAFQ